MPYQPMMTLPATIPEDPAASPRRLGWPALLIGVMLLMALGLLVVGWILPFFSITKLYFWTDRVSLATTVGHLWDSGDYLLFAVIAGFSMLFPALKLLAGVWAWGGVVLGRPRNLTTLSAIQFLGKWSMIDVFVVALIVVAVKSTLFANVVVHPGLYVFCSAVLLSMIALAWLERRLRRTNPIPTV